MYKKIMFSVLMLAIMWVSLFISQDAHAATEAKILYMEGDIEVKAADEGEWAAAYQGMELSMGDTIKAGKRSWAEVAIGRDEKNIIKVGKKTEITLNELSPVRLSLVNGEVRSVVEGLKEGSTFEVVTPTAVCGVRGSGFVAKTNGKKTTVSAFKHDAFARGKNKDGSLMSEVIIKEGFKSTIKKFERPAKARKLTSREKKDWNSWKGALSNKLGRPVNAAKREIKPKESKKMHMQSRKLEKKFKKVDKVANRKNLLNKRDDNKHEFRRKRNGGDEEDLRKPPPPPPPTNSDGQYP